MSPKKGDYRYSLEIFEEASGFYGATWHGREGGGAVSTKSPDALDAYAKVVRVIKRELRKALETKDERAERIRRRKEALRRAKEKGLI